MPDLVTKQIILIAHNLRSCHNVGSLLRTAEGLGVYEVIFSGYTPYPTTLDDDRLPHESAKITRQIKKTALGAEDFIGWRHELDIFPVLDDLRADGWQIACLEQSPDSVALPHFIPPPKLVLIVGREVEGIEPNVVLASDVILEIPMSGRKESFNVVQAAAMALYHCRMHV